MQNSSVLIESFIGCLRRIIKNTIVSLSFLMAFSIFISRGQQTPAESSRHQQRAADTSRGQQTPTEGSRYQQRAADTNRGQQTPTEGSRHQQRAADSRLSAALWPP